MSRLLKVGIVGSSVVLLLSEPKVRRAVIGAVAFAVEGAERAFNELVARGERISKG